MDLEFSDCGSLKEGFILRFIGIHRSGTHHYWEGGPRNEAIDFRIVIVRKVRNWRG